MYVPTGKLPTIAMNFDDVTCTLKQSVSMLHQTTPRILFYVVKLHFFFLQNAVLTCK